MPPGFPCPRGVAGEEQQGSPFLAAALTLEFLPQRGQLLGDPRLLDGGGLLFVHAHLELALGPAQLKLLLGQQPLRAGKLVLDLAQAGGRIRTLLRQDPGKLQVQVIVLFLGCRTRAACAQGGTAVVRCLGKPCLGKLSGFDNRKRGGVQCHAGLA